MRIVVDTNVFVSAALRQGSLPALSLFLIERRCTLLRSAATEEELFEVIDRPRFARLVAPDFRAWLADLFVRGESVTISERVTECRDPKDNKFLELAVNGRADLILSGDNDLLVLGDFRGIPIVQPGAFFEMMTG
jgi:putative PIN family toxin of toxin-antitoxin system